MNRATVVLLMAGVIALLACNWLESFDILRGPSINGAQPLISLRDLVQLTISALLLAASLFVVLSKRYRPEERHWAYGTLGTLIGFWLKIT
jgi:hypothetical protein